MALSKSWKHACLALSAALIVTPAYAQEADVGVEIQAQDALEDGFMGALRGCEEWVLTPSSWANGFEPFVEAVGLGNTMGKVASVAEEALPPEAYRAANHYWRINSTPVAGFILVVSDRIPFCHITGGGGEDLQPIVEAVLASQEFLDRWEIGEDLLDGDKITTTYINVEAPKMWMVVSRANGPGQRRDRVQVLASGQFDLGE